VLTNEGTNGAGDVHEQESFRESWAVDARSGGSTTDADERVEVTAAVTSRDVPATSHKRRRLVVAAVVLALAAVGGFAIIARPSPKPAPSKPASPPVAADSHAQFPYETASDVVSYSDHVAIVTVVSESEVTPTPTPETGGPAEPTIARRVTFRVDDVLWSRADAPAAPAKFTALWGGWLAKNHRPFVVDGTPWVFVGGHYVVPIAFDGKEFSPIQPFAVFRFDHGAVALEEQDTPLARSLARASRDEVTNVFANAVPDPLAVRYRDLLPRARLNAVIAARTS